MGRLDVHAKLILRARPEALVRLALPGRSIRKVTAEETELPERALRMDKVYRVEARERPTEWLHIEVFASWASHVPETVFRYWSRASELYEPLTSLVLVLKPGQKQGRPRKEHVRDLVRLGFELKLAWELDAEELLRGEPGLLPFLPYARGASIERIDRAFARLRRVGRGREDLMAALAVFAADVFPDVPWRERIPEEARVKNTFIEAVKAEGKVEGKVEGLLQAVIVQLRERRAAGVARRLRARLEVAGDDQLVAVLAFLAHAPPLDEIEPRLGRLLPRAPRSVGGRRAARGR